MLLVPSRKMLMKRGKPQPKPVEIEALLTPADLIKILKLSRATVYRLLQEGNPEGIPFIWIGDSKRVSPSDLRDWLAVRKTSSFQF
ncbi:helix-turn-helix domain-containing protein [Thermosporothrix hazakensis]|jgi:predicted DNA-binding transcriptional regulator AlpA